MSRKQIVVVEDERIVAADIQSRLEEMNYEVAGLAAAGAEGVELVERVRPDLVLMDIKLDGEMDGIEAATRIRERCDIPVVYLTAYDDDDTLGRAKISQPFGYVLKPFDSRDLRTAIEVALYKHKMESALRAAEVKFRFLYNSSPAIHIAVRADGSVTNVNPTLLAAIGATRDELIGRHLIELAVPDQSGLMVEYLDKLLSGQECAELEVDLQTSSGPPRSVLLSAVKCDDRGGSPDVAYAISGIDVTERKRADEALRVANQHLEKARRMEIVGKLAGGVAHHFNNLLTVIQGNAQLLAVGRESDSELADGLAEITHASRRAADLTDQLLAYTRRGMSQGAPVDVNEVVNDVADAIGLDTDQAVTVTRNLCEGSPVVVGDGGQIREAIFNLAVNAAEAMPGGGELALATEIVAAEDSGRDRPEADQTGRYVRVSVTDAGVGMDSETLDHIFEPFFTTKPTGEAVGLGLAVVYGCARDHKGNVLVDSRPDHGTTVKLFLPLREDDASVVEPDASAQEPPPGL